MQKVMTNELQEKGLLPLWLEYEFSSQRREWYWDTFQTVTTLNGSKLSND